MKHRCDTDKAKWDFALGRTKVEFRRTDLDFLSVGLGFDSRQITYYYEIAYGKTENLLKAVTTTVPTT
ncbi:MAG TPA: hypothetical protein VMV10_09685 [Pirellulales bacterium]|nr:hypothetical protein [Pirellulales bacterium]